MTTHSLTDPTTTASVEDTLAAVPPSDIDIDARLAKLEAARVRQLEALGDNDRDAVTIAYRRSVIRILEEVRTARRQVAVGRYGRCTGCRQEIAAERLKLRPWATRCATCARRERY